MTDDVKSDLLSRIDDLVAICEEVTGEAYQFGFDATSGHDQDTNVINDVNLTLFVLTEDDEDSALYRDQLPDWVMRWYASSRDWLDKVGAL